MVRATTSTGVLKAMVAIFASGDPSDAAAVVAEEYLDHQGLGAGPIRGIDGFALVVRTNHAAYEHRRSRSRTSLAWTIGRWRESGGGVNDTTVQSWTAKPSTSSESPMAWPWSTGAHAPEPRARSLGPNQRADQPVGAICRTSHSARATTPVDRCAPPTAGQGAADGAAANVSRVSATSSSIHQHPPARRSRRAHRGAWRGSPARH